MGHIFKFKTLNYKTFGKNIKENLWDLSLSQESLQLTSKAQFRREKIDKFNFIKIKNLFSAKETVGGWKEKLHSGKNICKSRVWEKTGNGIHEELSKLNHKQKKVKKKSQFN